MMSVLAHLFSLAVALAAGHCAWRAIVAKHSTDRAIATAGAAALTMLFVGLFLFGRP